MRRIKEDYCEKKRLINKMEYGCFMIRTKEINEKD